MIQKNNQEKIPKKEKTEIEEIDNNDNNDNNTENTKDDSLLEKMKENNFFKIRSKIGFYRDKLSTLTKEMSNFFCKIIESIEKDPNVKTSEKKFLFKVDKLPDGFNASIDGNIKNELKLLEYYDQG